MAALPAWAILTTRRHQGRGQGAHQITRRRSTWFSVIGIVLDDDNRGASRIGDQVPEQDLQVRESQTPTVARHVGGGRFQEVEDVDIHMHHVVLGRPGQRVHGREGGFARIRGHIQRGGQRS